MRRLGLLLALLLLVFAIVFFAAGRAAGPTVEVAAPTKFIGQDTTLDVNVGAPGGQLSQLDVSLEQGGQMTPLFSLPGNSASTLTQVDADRVQLQRPVGKRGLPEIQEGPGRIVITAARPVLFGIRHTVTTVSRDVEVRLTPPRIGVLSMFHFVNHGGSELVVYRATPADVASGVQVGETRYRGFPAADAGVASADPSLKVAFFALTYDQDVQTPISVFAKDEAGNQAQASVDTRVFRKPFRRSRIEVDDGFLARVVPAIAQSSPALKLTNPQDLVASYLQINGELRRINDAQLRVLAEKTTPKVLWDGEFKQLTNSQVEASFADHRTYYYKGKEIDQQVHLGFDLAVTAGIPVEAANNGVVLLAEYFGIYGNAVIIDHGLGVQSLYGHLSSIDVTPGTEVKKNQPIGRSGMTGLAGGDHLHFTMLVGGHAVNPVDWWSKQWIEDRITRKLREAGATLTGTR